MNHVKPNLSFDRGITRFDESFKDAADTGA